MALTLLGKSATAIWSETAPVDTSFMWMRILDPLDADKVIPYHYKGGQWRQFSSTYWTDAVIDIRNAPPGLPAIGQRHIIGTAPTGAWTGQQNKIATWAAAGWIFDSVNFGTTVPVLNSKTIYAFYSPGTWQSIGWEKDRIIVDSNLPNPIIQDMAGKRERDFVFDTAISAAKEIQFSNADFFQEAKTYLTVSGNPIITVPSIVVVNPQFLTWGTNGITGKREWTADPGRWRMEWKNDGTNIQLDMFGTFS